MSDHTRELVCASQASVRGELAEQEVIAGRMRAPDAGAAFRSGALRLCLRGGGTLAEGAP